MRKIYSSSGTIVIKSDNNYYNFYNDKTGMHLYLHKKDINYFMNIGTNKRFLTVNSYSNCITDNEKRSIKIYLKIKNKKLRTIKSLLNNGEKLEDIINIMPLKSLIEYIGDNKWKNL